MKYKTLFHHMHAEHGLILLNSEIQEMQHHFDKDAVKYERNQWLYIWLITIIIFTGIAFANQNEIKELKTKLEVKK